jgi:hypothetical protein
MHELTAVVVFVLQMMNGATASRAFQGVTPTVSVPVSKSTAEHPFFFSSLSLRLTVRNSLFRSHAAARPQGWHFYCAPRPIVHRARDGTNPQTSHPRWIGFGPSRSQPNGQINIYFPAIKVIAPNENRSNCDGNKHTFLWSNLIYLFVLLRITGN